MAEAAVQEKRERRPRGTGSIFQRGGAWWISYYQNGKRFFESAGAGSNKTHATNLLKSRLAQIQNQELIAPKDRRVTIQQLWDDLIAEKKMRKQDDTHADARWEKRLKHVFGHLRASQVTTDMLKKYVRDQQQASLADATINRDLADLKHAFRLGHRATPRKVAQVPLFPMLEEDNVRTGFIDDAQYDSLAQHATELWLRTLLALAYNFGWRKGELLNLRVNQVDLLNKTIRIWRGRSKSKSGEPRLASFEGLDDVYRLLCEAVKGKAPEDHVLTRGTEPVKDFRGAWDSLCEAAGVDLLVHDLRRSAVRNMVRRGIPQKTAMTISGHKTASVFERYNIVDDSDLKEAARKMAAGRKNGDRMVTFEQRREARQGRGN